MCVFMYRSYLGDAKKQFSNFYIDAYVPSYLFVCIHDWGRNDEYI